MLIDRVRKALQVILNKDEVGGYLRPSAFAHTCNDVQLELLLELKAGKDGKQKMPSIVTMSGSGGHVIALDELSNFMKTASVFPPQYQKPSDYISYEDMEAFWAEGSQFVNVDVLSVDEFSEREGSDIAKPTQRRPIAKIVGDRFVLSPTNLSVSLTYIFRPPIPYWNFTISSGEPVFAETGGAGVNPNPGVANDVSTDFLFSDMMLPELVLRISSKMGISLRESDVFQMIKGEEQT